ncbi:hypothetical protein C2869_02325 [Saccharobesus litoralis]|uniref:histidine kinase n=1 Tax=Saccharobesus litoralis TaxID=2172099 RepID=A0A2S0VMA7_9ALTE|nr:ATP-binding protein [Saccharobesus litoralis]AWB65347.1 hypothetical protein C2869_02325 [Saccharobesus litoralis]
MSISSKLIAALIFALTLLVSAMYVLIQWGFDREMLEYVNQREAAKLDRLVDNIVLYHKTYGVDSLSEHRSRWHKLLQIAGADQVISQEELISIDDNDYRHLIPSNGRRPIKKRNHYSPKGSDRQQHRPTYPDRPPHMKPGQTEKNSPQRRRQTAPGPALLDANKQVIVGSLKEGFRPVPIKMNNQTIAYFTAPVKRKITDELDVRFVNKQTESLLLICLFVLVITLVVAIPMARLLSTPIKKLARATSEVKKGNYDIRIKPKGRDELSQLARDFVDMAKALEQNEEGRKKWLADVSHELRTPIAIFKGEIEAMLDGIRPLNQDNIKSLQEEATHLQNLIDDLHELASSDVGALKYNKEELDLDELLTLAVKRHSATVTQNAFTIEYQSADDCVWVWGDATRLSQVIDNIIKNSIKYTDQPGRTSITLLQKAKTVELVFEDTPPGVPDMALPHLFDYLYRVESSRNRSTGGSGLGLALCQKIVENHQGDIQAYHAQSGGLGIKITLPALL